MSLLHQIILLGFELLVQLRHVVTLEFAVDLLKLVREEIRLQGERLDQVLVRLQMKGIGRTVDSGLMSGMSRYLLAHSVCLRTLPRWTTENHFSESTSSEVSLAEQQQCWLALMI